MTPRHESLAAGHLDGSLSPAEEAELLEALRADPRFLDALAAETALHRHLQLRSIRSEAGEARAADRVLHYVRATEQGTRFLQSVRRRAQGGTRRRGERRPPGATGSWMVAAAALVAIALAFLLLNSPPASVRPVEQARRPLAPAAPESPAVDSRREGPPRREPPRLEAPPSIEIDRRPGEPRVEETPKEAPAPPHPVDAPAPTPTPTQVTRVPGPARVESIRGAASAPEGTELAAGEGFETRGAESAAVLRFADGSRVELGGESALGSIATRKPSGTVVAVARGSCSAEVARQPAGSAFVFTTPHAEVRVVGTRLAVRVEADVTRVQVTEGQVRVSALKASAAVTLSAGQGADVGPTGAPRSHLLGLRAQYWDQNTFKGAPVLERVEPGIEIVLNEKDAPPVGTDHDFGVRWEGRFLAEREGEYVFLLAVDGHEKLTLDGAVAVNEKPQFFHGGRVSAVRRRLTAGWHDLAVEYCDDDAKSRCTLRFVPPGQAPRDGDDLQRLESGFAIPARLFSHRR